MRFVGFKTGEREMITEVNTVLILVATLALMAVISLAVILLVRRRVWHRVVESEVTTDSEWSLGTVSEPSLNVILSSENGALDMYSLRVLRPSASPAFIGLPH
ncbi:MAG: hypothetical protein KAR44_12665 [Candidatus Aegiribacteria sp.]|nr:hypothetical protein [Candidatus Aegiribacteria sp.]